MLCWSRNSPNFVETYASLPFRNSVILVCILRQINPLHTFPLFQYYFSISISRSLSCLFPESDATEMSYVFLFFGTGATCFFRRIPHDVIRRLEIVSSSLCSFLHLPVSSSLFRPDVSLNTLLSNTTVLCCLLSMKDEVSYLYTSKITEST